jgi:hypothetical protein
MFSRSGYQLAILLVCSSILAVALLLNLRGKGVVLPVIGMLPDICMWRLYLGIDCPGCGLTRCFVAIAHGQLSKAWHFNPAGFLIFAVLLYQLPFRAIQIWRIGHGRLEYRHGIWVVNFTAWTILVAVFVQWAWRQIG